MLRLRQQEQTEIHKLIKAMKLVSGAALAASFISLMAIMMCFYAGIGIFYGRIYPMRSGTYQLVGDDAMKITEIAQNFMKKVGVINDPDTELKYESEWIYNLVKDISLDKWEAESEDISEQWYDMDETISEALDDRMGEEYNKELESEGISLEKDMKFVRPEKAINEHCENGRKEIAYQSYKLKIREKIKEREKIREQNKLEKGMKEIKKEVKSNRAINRTGQSKKSDRSRKNTQVKRRSKKSGLSLFM